MNTHVLSQKRWLWVFLFILVFFGVYLNQSYAHMYRFLGENNLATSLVYLESPVSFDQSARGVSVSSTHIVTMGDSLTAGVGVPTQEQSYPYLFATKISQEQKKNVSLTNLGVPGAKSSDVLSGQVGGAVAIQPDVVTLCIGVNDMHNFVSQEQFRANLESIIGRLSSETNAQIVVMTIPFIGTNDLMRFPYQSVFNYRTQQYNETIRAVATAKQVQLVDMYNETIDTFYTDKTMYSSDQFHPSQKGYSLMADVLYAGVSR
jgi:lysophospholipase L1-like esterase